MFRSIAFYIGEKTLDLNGHAFPLGELTAEVLSITPDEYHKLRRILTKAVRKMANYEKSHQMQDWFDANEQMIKLHRSLVRHRVFQRFQEDGRDFVRGASADRAVLFVSGAGGLRSQRIGIWRSQLRSETTKTIWSIRRSMAAMILSALS